MNNQFYEIPTDWYNEFNNTFIKNTENINNQNTNNMINPTLGFIRGNIFNNLYNPYKNYQNQEPQINDRRIALLYEIQKHNFVLTELQLYLDINPYDKNTLSLYNQYLLAEKKLCNEYEQNYGPLTMTGMNMGMNKWNWIESPWPWEVMK